MPGKWSELASLIRSAPGRVCWELFAGTAGLSHAFANGGWLTAPPEDIVSDPEFDLLNPPFLVLVLGIILEGWIPVIFPLMVLVLSTLTVFIAMQMLVCREEPYKPPPEAPVQSTRCPIRPPEPAVPCSRPWNGVQTANAGVTSANGT